MIVLDILTWVGLVLLVLLALVLLMPIRYRAEGVASDEELSWALRFGWAFGVLSLRFGPEGTTIRLVGLPIRRKQTRDEPAEDDAKAAARRARRSEKRREKKERARQRPKRRRGIAWFVANRRLLLAVLRRYLRALHLRGEIRGVVGLSDPDETASLQRFLVAADHVLPAGVMQIEVDWVEEVVDLRGRAGGWVWPLQVVAITLALFVNRSAWRALRAA